MRLFHYAPAVSNSYCVGIHNGHGIGSVFGKIFSRVAAKSAARAATAAAKRGAAKIVRAAVPSLRIALGKAIDQGKNLAREHGKELIQKGSRVLGEKASSLVDRASTVAESLGVPQRTTHLLSSHAKDAVNETLTRGAKAADLNLDQGLDQLEARAKDRLGQPASQEPTIRRGALGYRGTVKGKPKRRNLKRTPEPRKDSRKNLKRTSKEAPQGPAVKRRKVELENLNQLMFNDE